MNKRKAPTSLKVYTRLLHTVIYSLVAIILSACSGSSAMNETTPEMVTDVSFPFFDKDTLYNFDPETGTKESLAQSNKKLMIALDTDLSSKETNDNNATFFNHTVLPEYVVYVQDSSLRLYDLHTRYDHTLINFKIDNLTKADAQRKAQILTQQADSAGDAEDLLQQRDRLLNEVIDKQICDIRKSIILDEESRLDQQIIFKDEKLVYIKITPIEQDCANKNADFQYFQVAIEETKKPTFEGGRKTTFKIRRNTLKEHEHKHKHEHEHTGIHDHEHNFANGERDKDGNIFDISNHIHTHIHTHNFLYGDLEEHEFFTKAELDAVHNDPKNQEVVTEEHPILVGKKSIIDPALMYAGTPIVDIQNNQYGYFGFNEAESTYKFYTIDTETLKKTKLWQMNNSEFSINHRQQRHIVNADILKPFENKHVSYTELLNDGILIQFNSKVVKLNLVDFFDDDLDAERAFSVDNPIFEFTQDASNAPELQYETNTNQIIIKDMNQLYIFDNSTLDTAQLVRTIEDINLTDFKVLTRFDQDIILLKTFSLAGNSDERSFTRVNTLTGQEQTLQAKTSDTVLFISFSNALFTSLEINTAPSPLNWESQVYSGSLLPLFTPPLSQSFWQFVSDYRIINKVQGKQYAAMLFSDASSFSANSVPRLSSPSLFKFDAEKTTGQGELLGVVPSEVILKFNQVTILNEFYGFIEIKEDSAPNTPTKVYFFPPGKSSVNPTGAFGDMKFMFEETPE